MPYISYHAIPDFLLMVNFDGICLHLMLHVFSETHINFINPKKMFFVAKLSILSLSFSPWLAQLLCSILYYGGKVHMFK